MTDRTDVWTYASANTVTVPTDLTATYYAGLKTSIVQTTTKYFQIESSTYSAGTGLTTITLNGYGTYTVANAAITAHSDFVAEAPPGFPLAYESSGRAGGQTLKGGTASGEDLTLMSTANVKKGDIIFGTSKYDEDNNRLGIGRTPATYPLEVQGDTYTTGSFRGDLIGNVTGNASNNITGPASAIDGNIVVFDGITGKLAKDGLCSSVSFAASSHSHAATDITSGTLDGDVLPAISETKKGGCPATGTPSGKYLKDNGTWDTPPAGSGDVVGPSSAVGDNLTAFDSTTGKLIKDSLIPLSSLINGWIPVNDSWSYSSATEITVPSGAASLYSPGMRVKLTQATVKYFIITAVADAKLTVFGGTDYTLVSAAISDQSVSTHKAPIGFPLDPAKWTVVTTSTSDSSQSNPVNGTWYNKGGSLAIPIGAWKVSYSALLAATENTDYYVAPVFATLSTANNTESEKKYTRGGNLFWVSAGYGALYFSVDLPAAYLNLAAATTYYLNIAVKVAGVDSISFNGATQTTMIRAVCAYL